MSSHLERLQELFERLVELPRDAREAWLEREEPDANLRREALALAAADESGPDSRDRLTRRVQSAIEDLSEPVASGQRLGPYRLMREIGSGGMGTVFLAERVDAEFDRLVAIKLIRGIATRDASRRLRQERQILADLAHPHIARLLDGGTTEASQPYLVMEFVDGVTVTEFSRTRALSRSARLELVQKIARAVHYAHQRLIVHRDLKPANVLVRPDGEPVLLDFGIAKLLDADSTGPDAHTGIPWFTPGYASPEQRRGEPVSTATDVYALGLLTYELVTDQVPPAETTVSLHLPTGTRRRGDGDLDTIIAKATHPEAARRYASAQALADDIRRFLRGRPIEAAPDRLGYRLRKFVARHPLAVAASALVALLAIGFTWRLAVERDRALRAEALAEQESTTSRHVVDYVTALFRSASPDQAGRRPIAPRELIDRGRKEIETGLSAEPRQRARLLGVLGRIYVELGAPDAAADVLKEAADLELANGTPRQRATYLAALAEAYALDERPGEAQTTLEQARALLESATPRDDAELADVLGSLGLAKARSGDPGAGNADLQRALDLATRTDGVDSVRYARLLVVQGEVKMRGGETAVAENVTAQGLATLRAHLAPDDPEVIKSMGFMTQVYSQQDRFAESEKLLREMLALRLRTVEPNSALAITVRNNLAQVINAQGRNVEAIELLRENLQYQRDAHDQSSPSYVISLNNLASLIEQTGDYAASADLFREALDITERSAGNESDPRVPTFRQNLGRSLMLAGRLDEALPFLQRDIEGSAESIDLNIERGRRLNHLAEWNRRSRRYDEAMRYVDRAQAAFAALYPAEHPRLGGVARTRALVLRDTGHADEAEKEMRAALASLRKGVGPDANVTLETELLLAQLLAARGADDEARALLKHLEPLVTQRFVAGAWARRDLAELVRHLGAGTS